MTTKKTLFRKLKVPELIITRPKSAVLYDRLKARKKRKHRVK